VHLYLRASSILSLSKDAQEGFFDRLRMPSCAGTLRQKRAVSGLPQTANAPGGHSVLTLGWVSARICPRCHDLWLLQASDPVHR